MTQVFFRAAVSLSPGTRQFDSPANFAADATQLKISFDKDAWPGTGGVAFLINMYVSPDAGDTWQLLGFSDFIDLPWLNKQGLEFLTGSITLKPIPFPGNPTRRIRAEIITSKAVDVANISVDVI